MIYLYNDNEKSLKINYNIIGEGKPIIMVHGLTCDMRIMKGCMEKIFTKNNLSNKYMRIYIDLPGMGMSEDTKNIASSDKILEILLLFIKEKVKDKFILVGESYGGYLVRGILSEMLENVDGICLICPVIFAENEDRILPKKYIIEEDKDFLEKLDNNDKETQKYIERMVIINEYTYERYKKEIYSGVKIANINFIKKLKENYSFTFNVDKKIGKKFDKPALFLAGKQDNIVGYEQLFNLSKNYNRASFSVIDGTGHNLQIENPLLFEILIEDWLKKIK